MNALFGVANWDDLAYETVNPAVLFSSSYDFIYMDGGADNDGPMNTFIAANQALMETWVNNGGRLYLNSGGWNTSVNYGFGGVTANLGTHSENASAVNGAHPIFNGPFLPVGTSFSGQSFAHDNITGGVTSPIMTGEGGVILAEANWGSGLVLFGGITGPFAWSPSPEGYNLLRNILSYASGYDPTADVTPPIVNVPANITVPQAVPGGAVVNFTVTATDETSPANPVVTCDWSSGDTFPVGTTTVNCSATDDANNTGYGSFTVTVTAAPGGNLLKKPDFANAAVFPTPWRAFGFRAPYTGVLDCKYFNNGPCSVVFGPGNRAGIQQVNRTGLAGDMYSFGMYSASQNAPIGGDYRIEVGFFNNLNKPMGKFTVYFNPLTHGFELASGNAAATGNYNKIIFKFIYNNSSGRAWFDDAFLYFVP
jgi:hypothetical protein